MVCIHSDMQEDILGEPAVDMSWPKGAPAMKPRSAGEGLRPWFHSRNFFRPISYEVKPRLLATMLEYRPALKPCHACHVLDGAAYKHLLQRYVLTWVP